MVLAITPWADIFSGTVMTVGLSVPLMLGGDGESGRKLTRSATEIARSGDVGPNRLGRDGEGDALIRVHGGGERLRRGDREVGARANSGTDDCEGAVAVFDTW